jgi:hypothetical protein
VTGCNWVRQGPVAGHCEHGNECSGPIRGGNVLTSQVIVSFSGNTLFHGVSKFIS